MYDDIVETYRCILSCRLNLPGMRLEDALNESAVRGMQRELDWLKRHEQEIRDLDAPVRERS